MPLAEMARARGADLWLDGAHNPHATAAIADTMTDMRREDGRPLVVVLGLLANKDARAVLMALRAVSPIRLMFVGFDAETAAVLAALLEAACSLGVEAEVHDDVTAAVGAAVAGDGRPPHILICGSLYLAGEVLATDPQSWPT